jgi:predicted AAA+ superfamily ATPase
MVNRLVRHSKTHSFFLFGNRGVGKSTYLETQFPRDRFFWLDLLDPNLNKKLSINPGLLAGMLAEEKKRRPKGSVVVIDEIQKIPDLLDIVHSQIEAKHFVFALTGSSSRKLKKQGVNLLAGRAFVYFLFPLTHLELGSEFDLNESLTWGTLPTLSSLKEIEDKIDYLNAYSDTYLREEIIAEQIVRNIAPFRHFLEVAAQSNAKILNYSNIAKAINVDITTVQNYFHILEDTFTGVLLQPFHESIRERQRKNPKFYFFDLGITRALQNRLTLPVSDQTYEYGELFEQFILLEVIRLNEYHRKSWRLSYLKTKDNVEVDLIIERPGLPRLLIEIKSTVSISSLPATTFMGVRGLAKSMKKVETICLSRDETEFMEGGIRFIHWRRFFAEQFGGKR